MGMGKGFKQFQTNVWILNTHSYTHKVSNTKTDGCMQAWIYTFSRLRRHPWMKFQTQISPVSIGLASQRARNTRVDVKNGNGVGGDVDTHTTIMVA